MQCRLTSATVVAISTGQIWALGRPVPMRCGTKRKIAGDVLTVTTQVHVTMATALTKCWQKAISSTWHMGTNQNVIVRTQLWHQYLKTDTVQYCSTQRCGMHCCKAEQLTLRTMRLVNSSPQTLLLRKTQHRAQRRRKGFPSVHSSPRSMQPYIWYVLSSSGSSPGWAWVLWLHKIIFSAN